LARRRALLELRAPGWCPAGARCHDRHDGRAGVRPGGRYPRRALRPLRRGRARCGGAGVPSERGADRTGARALHQGLVRRVMTWLWWSLGALVLIFAAREFVTRTSRHEMLANATADALGAPALMITT